MKMRHVDSPGGAPSTANDTWRTWLMTGVRRNGVDRRRVRGAHLGIKKMLVEGMHVRSDKPYTWKDFSDAMVRQSVGEAMRELPYRDSQLIKLAYFGGMSNREIADHMWMAEGTVERRLRRALDTIIWPACVRDICNAGHNPNSTAVASATAALKNITGRLMRITTSGTAAKICGIRLAMSSSRNMFHFDIPPITGELSAKTTRPIQASRMQ